MARRPTARRVEEFVLFFRVLYEDGTQTLEPQGAAGFRNTRRYRRRPARQSRISRRTEKKKIAEMSGRPRTTSILQPAHAPLGKDRIPTAVQVYVTRQTTQLRRSTS